jgi:histidyl-tRNA synthetase
VRRFTGTLVPATGASIGVDRLLAALKTLGKLGAAAASGPVLVTVMDRERLLDYQRMVAALRAGGIAAELYVGDGDFRAQLKYADRRQVPLAVIAGGNEFSRGEVSVKDLRLGKSLAKGIASRDEWLRNKPAQSTVPAGDLVVRVKEMLSAGEGAR